MGRSPRWDRIKIVGLSVLLAALAGWALWVTSPKPELTTVTWPSPFDAEYVEQHRGEIVSGVSESFSLLTLLAHLAGAGDTEAGVPEPARPYVPARGHQYVAAVFETLRTTDIAELAGIFAFELRGGRLERTLPHDLPAFEEMLGPHLGALAAFAGESGFRDRFAVERSRYEAQLDASLASLRFDRMRAWLEFEFPAATHDAYRVVASPFLGRAPFSHVFAGTQPSYSELAIFLPSESEFLEPEVFAALARRYVSPMTDRYIRIVNRVFANVAVWREGAIDEEPAEVFNEYMIWATYVLYAQSTRAEGAGERATAGDVRAATALEAATSRMRALGYLRFQDFAERLAKLYDERRESERLQTLYPKMMREAIRLAREYEPF